MTKRKRLVVIDGKSVFYRGYYAMPGLSTKDGTPTGGVFGFATMALEVLKQLDPDYVCVAWDKAKTNIRKRKELYPEYKAGRKPAPPDFYAQVPILHELLEAFGWPLYELDDYEADDIMGTLARKATDKDIETLLVTSDMDLLQVVDPLVHVYALKKGLSNIELFTPESFAEKYGISVDQFLDFKSLMGDSSDNIPGVPGIGKKGASDLLNEHKTLDGVYENIDLIKESHRKKLVAGKDSAYLSKKIAAIWTDAPVDLELKRLDIKNCKPEKVREVLQKLEFRTLVRQLPDAMQLSEEAVEKSTQADIKPIKTTQITSEDQLKSIKIPSPAFIHIRCAGTHGKKPSLLIIGSPKQAYVVHVSAISAKALKDLLGSIGQVAGYDIKSDLQVWLELGLELPEVTHDVQVGGFLLNSLRREQSLSELAANELDYQGSLENLPDSELAERAGEMIALTTALHKKQTEELSALDKLDNLASTIEWPIISVLARMEHRGIFLDTDYMHIMREKLSDAISDLEQQIYGYADAEFNISSPSQLATILYEKLGLSTQGVKKGKTGYSTAAAELDKLKDAHPIIEFISQYREVTKLKSTYVDTLPEQVDEKSRLHTTFALTVAQTGRLSSHDPNLQNIPVKTPLGKQIRSAFIAGEGRTFVSADYSQFELRLAAYLSNDERLIEMFNRDEDVHLATAAEVYNREPQDITKNMRRDAKVVNFGIMYGLSTHGLVRATSMGYDQAKHFIDRYFEIRPKLKAYIEKVRQDAKEKGYVENIFGRRRPTPDVHSSNFMVREGAYRAAVNMPFQGSAADIMKLAMVKIQDKLAGTDSHMLLQIHDSVIVECNEADAKDIETLLKETMEDVHKLPVKLTVDTSTGQNWGAL